MSLVELTYTTIGATVALRKAGTMTFGHGFIKELADGKSYIFTNYHVVGNGEVEITDFGGSTYRGKVHSFDRWADIALVETESFINVPLSFAPKHMGPFIGQPVIAIGSPNNFKFTMSPGHITGLNRKPGNVSSMTNLLQTNAYIDKGSSGGPLIDLNGDVVGMAQSYVPNTPLGFAIPADTIRELFP